MNIKVLAGYNRFKSDIVFFRQVENTRAMIEYENTRFQRFLIYNSSRISSMNDIVNQIRHQFSVNNLIWKCAIIFRGKTQRSPSQEQFKLNEMNKKVLAGYNRFKSDNVFFRKTEDSEDLIKYDEMLFRSFRNFNSSIISAMKNAKDLIESKFSVNNLIWKCAVFFRGNTQRSPSQEQFIV